MTIPAAQPDTQPKLARGIARWALQMTSMLIIYGVILMASAGRLDWAAGWAYLGMNALVQLVNGVVLIPRRPEMLADRTDVREGTKRWDRVLVPLVAIIGPLAIMITAGLDARFSWSQLSTGSLWIAALVGAFACGVFLTWAMASNNFFAASVRIQQERGHHVVSDGPYRLVRHPGYLGALIFDLLIPVALGSAWAWLPAAITIGLIVVRTALEDRTLQTELPGYREYTQRVRFRLIPGIW